MCRIHRGRLAIDSSVDSPTRAVSILNQALDSGGSPLDARILERMETAWWGPVTRVSSRNSRKACVEVNQPGDAWELEADGQAELVLRWPAGPHHSSADRQDFSQVMIHTGAAANDAAKFLRARAFVLGDHVFFADGEYRPDTHAGAWLLAHELTHVLQQRGTEPWLIQRSEVDSAALTPDEIANLDECWMEINQYVNAAIQKGREAARGPTGVETILQTVYDEIGVNPSRDVGYSKIEVWAGKLPPGKAIPPDKAKTKYQNVPGRGASKTTWLLWNGNPPLCPVIKLNNILVGTDKLGHFFQQGYQCYRENWDDHFLYKFDEAVKALKVVQGPNPMPEDRPARVYGWAMETGGFGLLTTGVYSKGDQAANLSGRQFWKDLAADPANYVFDIRKYVGPPWNEESNPSLYADGVGQPVWDVLLSRRNQTTQLSWQGQFVTSLGPGAKPQPMTAILQVQNATTVNGTFSFSFRGMGPQTFKLLNGRITYLMDSDEGVSSVRNLPSGSRPTYRSVIDAVYTGQVITGVRIDYDWTFLTGGGKGYFVSVDEQHLEGRFGNGTYNSNSGIITLSADGSPAPAGAREPNLQAAFKAAEQKAAPQQK
jgi:hypothetical protein